MRQGNVLNVLVISILLGFVYLGSIVAQDALKPNSESNTANALVGQLTCGLVCPTVESRIKTLETTVNRQQVTINQQQERIDEQEVVIGILQEDLSEAKPAIDLIAKVKECLRMEAGEINGLPGPHAIFERCNVHVRDGSGTTDGATNGLGNLVIGYNEEHEIRELDRSGSHNLIVGPEHTYSSFGGFVAGSFNTISGEHSSVSGGFQNTASGKESSVSGGNGNIASGDWSSVSGGVINEASGGGSSISGGANNEATASHSSVSGGAGNEASGLNSSVSGGLDRTADNINKWVAGGLSQPN